MPPSGKRVDGKRDRTHDPKPTSGWWGESDRHYIAAMKNNSRGGLGAAGRSVRRAVTAPKRLTGAAKGAAGVIHAAGSRRKG